MAEATAYERDPYLTELATEVVSTGEADGRPYALLADTLFYPEGGGQPADRGSLNGAPVLDVRRGDDGVRHFLEQSVSPGPAELRLEWRRRFDHMQQHTGQHLLSAIAAESFGWATTSFHLGARQCDIELDTESVDPDALPALEEEVMSHVRAARAVTARRVSPEEYAALDIRTRGLPEEHVGDVRLVEIEGVDVTTCGGTHLRSTAEIEALKLGPAEPMRGGTRLYWRAGGRVRRRLEELEGRNRDLRLLFETSGEELLAAAGAKLAALSETSRELRRTTATLAEARARALALDPRAVVDAEFENVDGGFLQRLARELLARAPYKTLFLTSSSGDGLLFVIASGDESGVDVATLGPKVAEKLGGRGGGSGAFFQGKAPTSSARDAAARLLADLIPTDG